MQVLDVGLKGVRCKTSGRTNRIFKGLRMRAQLCFPVIGTTQLSCEVAYVNQADDNSLMLGVEFLSNIEEVSALTAEYLMLTGSEASIRDLRDEGYRSDLD